MLDWADRRSTAKNKRHLIDAGESGMFDLIFIDALKEEYPEYFIKALHCGSGQHN